MTYSILLAVELVEDPRRLESSITLLWKFPCLCRTGCSRIFKPAS